MPRTKQRKPAPTSPGQDIALVKDFWKQVDYRVAKMESETELHIRGMETDIDMALARFPAALQKLTLGEIMAMKLDEDNCEVSSSVDNDVPTPVTVKAARTVKRTTAASDDGYVTEGTTAVTHKSRATKAAKATGRTRSSSRSKDDKLGKVLLQVPKADGGFKAPGSTARSSRYKTPANTRLQYAEYSMITPKVKPNTPLSVIRRPRQGEMALSMQGSPLMVNPTIEQTANVCVPLSDGNVLALLPNEGLRMSTIPTLDPETMRQLQTLQRHLQQVIGPK